MAAFNSIKKILSALLICAVFVPVCSAGTARSKTKPQRISVSKLLSKYAETQDKLQAFVVKGNSSADIHGSYSSPQWKAKSGKRKKFVSYEFRYDRNRFYWSHQMWGNLRFANEFIPKSKPHYKSVLWDGAVYYEYAKAPYIRPGPGSVKIDSSRDPNTVKKTIPYIPYICAPMFGFFDKERIDSVLHKAETISVRDKLELVRRSKCYVIDAVARSGKYIIWIDPKHGYNIAKAEIRRAENNFVSGKRLAKGRTMLSSMKNVRFEKISGVWIPMEADIQWANNLPNGDFSRVKTHYKRTEFIINPDHEKLSSFIPDDINEGAKVIRVNGVQVRGKGYTWQNGQVVDENGRKVDYESKKPSGSAGSKPKSLLTKRPTAFELLDKYAETQDKIQSYIIKSESSIEADNSFRIGIGKSGRLCEVRYDGNRADGNRVRLFEHLWGQVGNQLVPKASPIYRSWLWDGENYMRYTGPSKKRAKAANRFGKVHPYMSGASEIENGKLTSRMYGFALMGFFSGSEERADKVLRQAHSISVRDRTERINAVECYIIEADTPGGQYKVWIDPKHGYNIAKAKVELSEGKNHLFYGKPFEKVGKKLSFSLQTVRFEKIEGVWVPVEANTQSHRIYNKGDFSKARTHTKLTEVILNPDHNELGSFVPDDIPDGAKVAAFVDLNDGFFTAWDPEYRWASNAQFVVDRKGRWVRYEPDKGMLPVIKVLPELRELELEIDPRQTKNKRILLCFCDMRQRSSQQCVLELKEQAESLAHKGVTVALLQCSAGSMDRLNTWMRKNDIRFPVGKIEQIIKKVLRAWRVEKLPWLILTDKEHIITAEGFGVGELNEKIKEGGDAKD